MKIYIYQSLAGATMRTAKIASCGEHTRISWRSVQLHSAVGSDDLDL